MYNIFKKIIYGLFIIILMGVSFPFIIMLVFLSMYIYSDTEKKKCYKKEYTFNKDNYE